MKMGCDGQLRAGPGESPFGPEWSATYEDDGRDVIELSQLSMDVLFLEARNPGHEDAYSSDDDNRVAARNNARAGVRGIPEVRQPIEGMKGAKGGLLKIRETIESIEVRQPDELSRCRLLVHVPYNAA